MQKPCNKNCSGGQVSRSLVSDIMSISMFPLIMEDNCSYLFLKELILSGPIMRRFMFFILRKDCGSFSLLLFELIRRELHETLPILRVAFNGILLFWVTMSSPCEKHQNSQSLINLLKLPFKMRCYFLINYIHLDVIYQEISLVYCLC